MKAIFLSINPVSTRVKRTIAATVSERKVAGTQSWGMTCHEKVNHFIMSKTDLNETISLSYLKCKSGYLSDE